MHPINTPADIWPGARFDDDPAGPDQTAETALAHVRRVDWVRRITAVLGRLLAGAR